MFRSINKKICLIVGLALIPVLAACDNDPIVGPEFGDTVGQWLDQGWW